MEMVQKITSILTLNNKTTLYSRLAKLNDQDLSESFFLDLV